MHQASAFSLAEQKKSIYSSSHPATQAEEWNSLYKQPQTPKSSITKVHSVHLTKQQENGLAWENLQKIPRVQMKSVSACTGPYVQTSSNNQANQCKWWGEVVHCQRHWTKIVSPELGAKCEWNTHRVMLQQSQLALECVHSVFKQTKVGYQLETSPRPCPCHW